MISLGGTKINFQNDNPEGFAKLLTAVEPYVAEEDAERHKESSTSGETDSNQLAFQVYFKTCKRIYIQRLIFLSQLFGWLRGTVVERRSVTGKLCVLCLT